MGTQIAIVGGGPGGLMTAWLLRKYANQPFALTLFEASNRTGGKILTPRFAVRPVSYEAGAAEFYDYSPIDEDPLKQLVTELGLSITPMGGHSVFMSGQRYSTLEDLGVALGPEVQQGWVEFHERARALISPREFYEYDGSEPPPTRTSEQMSQDVTRFDSVEHQMTLPPLKTFLKTLIHSDLAAEWSQTDLGYGLQNYLMNHPDYMQLYSIAGGNEQLVQRLAENTAMDRRLNHRVLSVDRGTADKLKLTVEHAAGIVEQEFDFVIVCLPMLALKNVAFHGEQLFEAMQRHIQHYDHPANYLRVTLLFQRQFWRSWLTDSWCMLDSWGGCCLYDETSRQPDCPCGILGWLFAGDDAIKLSELSDEELIRTAIETLPKGQSEARELLLEGHVHRWPGSVSAMPGGERPTRLDLRHQPEPTQHPGLFLVGDYLFDSTLNGVLDSAECVAAWVAAELESTSP